VKKVFLQTQFGTPHPWTQQYFDNFRRLAPYGWYLKVFTPHPHPQSFGNIEIVPMTLGEFDERIAATCGVRPGNFLTPAGVPSKLVSDYYPAYGHILQEFIQGFDCWGHTNWDMVYGRLDHFVPDAVLAESDIWSDDVDAINGIFCLYRNNDRINNLFRKVPGWERMFVTHEPCAFDEHRMTEMVRTIRDEIRFRHPQYFPNHSYDRLPQHRPNPSLYWEADGALIERLEEPLAAPKGHYGREIMSFHFSRTKRWPL
jgi:hypothetical protein